ncbi:MAG: AMP-binding protein, partial [Deltaproteobacteria bacterium]|nr:AMP-binding protein [Deltaproteobacteria bacterium]
MNYSDKPWLKSYKLGPYKLKVTCEPYPMEALSKILDSASEKHGRKTAVQLRDRAVSYKELREQADALAFSLAGMGIRRGDRVCLFLPNCIEFVIGDWGIIKAGGASVPTSTMRTDEGLRQALARQITGKLEGAVAYSSTAEAQKNEAGSIDFTLTNGTYQLLEGILGFDRLDFSRVEGKISFRNGALKITRLVLTGEKLRCSLKGNILLADDIE